MRREAQTQAQASPIEVPLLDLQIAGEGVRYDAFQLRVRALRLQVAELERQSRFDPELADSLRGVRRRLQHAEEVAAQRLAREAV